MFDRVILSRTPCYGDCPVYTVDIDKYGNVKYIGEHFVYKLGECSWKIPEKKISRIIELLKDFNYKEFVYDPGNVFATDHPSCITTVVFENGEEKVIDHYLGHFDVDERLEKFEKTLERIIGVKKYVNPNMFIYHFKYTGMNRSGNLYNGHIVVAPNENDAINAIINHKDYNIVKEQWGIEKIGRALEDSLYCNIIMSEK